MKLAAFDLEVATEIPLGTKDFRDYAPWGIACAALAYESGDELQLEHFNDAPKLDGDGCEKLLDRMYGLVEDGYTLLTWNGCKFDFLALALESNNVKDCAWLAFECHVDLMLQFTFTRGHYLKLDSALEGMGLASKVHDVVLSDGKELHDMHGSQAPRLWEEGEYDAVLEYLEGDVIQLLALAKAVERHGKLAWVSSKGYSNAVDMPELKIVENCFNIPEPDTTWMTNPPKRDKFVDWIFDEDVVKELLAKRA